MASNTAKYIKLGVFVTATLMLFVIGIYNIGNRQNMFGNTITISAVFDNVKGLQKGNNVRFSGINVGTVSTITILSDTTVQVQMTLDAELKQYIRKDAVATINSDGIVGNMVVSIDQGQGELDLIEDGDIIKSYSRISSGDMLNTLNVTNENAALLTSDLLKITQSILNKNGTINTLLYDSLLANDIRQTIGHIHATTEQLEASSRKIDALINEINRPDNIVGWLTRDTLSASQLSNIIDNLAQTSKHLDSVVFDMQAFIREAQHPDGSLYAIMKDSVFANDLKETMYNLNEGTRRFNENMEALKYSFPLKKYYKKQQKKVEDSLQSTL